MPYKAAKSPTWKALSTLAKKSNKLSIRSLFKDKKRFEKMSLRWQDIFLDYSKNKLEDKTLKALIKLAKEADLKKYTEKMFSGERINWTENRAVLHVALRAPALKKSS